MKVNVWKIVTDHIRTLRNDVSEDVSVGDLLIFFLIPTLCGSFVYLKHVCISKEFYNVSVTFFGVFVALLLNFQVAAFGIYNRKWNESEDDKLAKVQNEELAVRRQLLREINANISYLILISTVSIVIFLFLYATKDTGAFPAALSWFIYTHFILTLLMVVKRSHILFTKEYDES